LSINSTTLSNQIKANLDSQFGDATFGTERQKVANAIGSAVADAHNADLVAGGLSFVDQETPAGTVNGVNATFTLAQAPTPASSLHLYLNGVRLRQGTDYTLSGTTITYVAGSVPQTGDTHHADYRY
jgi:hypothetical protein